eukprot:gene13278-15607_t
MNFKRVRISMAEDKCVKATDANASQGSSDSSRNNKNNSLSFSYHAPNVPKLRCNGDTLVDSIPTTLTALMIEDTPPSNPSNALLPGIIPSGSITYLKLSPTFNRRLVPGSIPSQVTHLTLGSEWFHHLDAGILPSSLTHLKIRNPYVIFNIDSWSASLTHLQLSEQYNFAIEPATLPPSLLSLTFGQAFNQKFEPGALPSHLTSLTLGRDYNQPIDRDIIPQSLTRLYINENFNIVSSLYFYNITKELIPSPSICIRYRGGPSKDMRSRFEQHVMNQLMSHHTIELQPNNYDTNSIITLRLISPTSILYSSLTRNTTLKVSNAIGL